MNLDLECENGQASGDQGKTCFHNNGLGFHAQATEKNCIDWKTVNHPYYRPDYYHELEQNYCRNPNGEKNAPWCFIGNDFSWKYCLSVPPCQSYGQIVGTKLWKPKNIWPVKRAAKESIIGLKTNDLSDIDLYNQFLPDVTERHFPVGCKFPFYYHGVLFNSCADLLEENDSWLPSSVVEKPIKICSVLGQKSAVTKDTFLICSGLDGKLRCLIQR